MKVHENYINGAWAKAPERAPNINPSNISDVVGEFARAGAEQARYAVEFYTAVKTSYVNP